MLNRRAIDFAVASNIDLIDLNQNQIIEKLYHDFKISAYQSLQTAGKLTGLPSA